MKLTPKQVGQFNCMRRTLRLIAKSYQTPQQIRRTSEKDIGLNYQETLEMAYENIQAEAEAAVRGIRELKVMI